MNFGCTVRFSPLTCLTLSLSAFDVVSVPPVCARMMKCFKAETGKKVICNLQDKGYADLKPAGWVREDYHILQGTRGEYFHGMVILFLLLQ